jgi:endonuclease G, mitochondrial
LKKSIFINCIFLCLTSIAFGQQVAKTNDGKRVFLYENGSWSYADSSTNGNQIAERLRGLEIPKLNPKDDLIFHMGYILSYNETFEQANWVAYKLTAGETKSVVERSNRFRVDPEVKTGTANDLDYKGTGYDKGHLAPAGDMGWSETTMQESFYYSNMSPQDPGFNRGVWKRLEELVRSWAVEDQVIYIVTGPVLTNGLPTIGTNEVAVPKYFYKVILVKQESGSRELGFIIPNAASGAPLQSFTVTIDSVETITGIDFFPALPDPEEKILESTLDLKPWSWKGSVSSRVEK